MPGNGDGKTVGIWVGADDDIVERFDEMWRDGSESYSRSDKIKEAMEMYIEIQSVIDELDYDLDNPRVRRSWVRQALLDRAREEAKSDG